jgi:hypothetical protein
MGTKKNYEKDIKGGRGGESVEVEGGVSWGPNTMFCVVSPAGATLLLSSSAHRTLLEIRAILLSRPSATLLFSLSTLSYTAPSLS